MLAAAPRLMRNIEGVQRGGGGCSLGGDDWLRRGLDISERGDNQSRVAAPK